MKKIVWAVFTAAALCAQGDDKGIAARLELCRPLADSPEKGAAGRVRIPGDVFDRSRNFPADLRILDEDGTQWPFFILTPSDRTLSEKWVSQILNKAFVAGRDPYWEFDLVMPEENRGAVHNRVEITTSGIDFVRRVEISRDTESEAPAHLGSGYLIGFPNNRNARNDTVSYPDSDAARMHVKVYTSAKNADEKFEVQSATVYYQNQISAERESVDALCCPVPEKETNERIQTLILDTGFKNRPVEFITFDVADPSFVRCVSVYGRNAENEPWHNAGSGEIHRLKKNEEFTVRVRTPYRWIKVDVRQDDNLPLDIQAVRLEAVPRYVVFEASSERSARLCFRGWDILAPRYDLKKRITEPAALALPIYELGVQKPNPQGAAPSVFRKYSRILGAVAVGVVSLLTIWIIISMMRRQNLRI
jgi:hypothetical protein